MYDYEVLMQIFIYNITAGCETGGCAEFHMFYCWQNRTCFYDSMYRSAVTALEMGWY